MPELVMQIVEIIGVVATLALAVAAVATTWHAARAAKAAHELNLRQIRHQFRSDIVDLIDSSVASRNLVTNHVTAYADAMDVPEGYAIIGWLRNEWARTSGLVEKERISAQRIIRGQFIERIKPWLRNANGFDNSPIK